MTPAEEVLRELLEELRPDVVHFMHLLYLSAGCVAQAARDGRPVFFTLHDYWLQCPRQGQRVHYDGSICHTIDFPRCGDCLAKYKFMQSPLERRAGKLVSSVRSATAT